MGSEGKCLKVLMFPWLAHGHIIPFIELARGLSDNSFESYICSTPANLTSIKNKLHGETSLRIHLVELHLPTSPELPPHYHTTNGLPLRLHSALRKALKGAKPDFLNLLRTLQPDLLIHDVMQPWAGVVASTQNIPSVTFFTSGATMLSYFVHLGVHPGVDFPFPPVRLSSFETSMALGKIEEYKEEEKDPDDEEYRRNYGMMIMNSSREMEGKYIDYAAEMLKKKIVPVGALVHNAADNGGDDDDDELMKWLAQKHERSTVFVSFGSEYFLRRKDIEEIAHGLELSKVNFIWIIRFPKGDETTAEAALPEGFLKRVGERGRIVEKWAPQARILRHPSIGGFVSHCGWNSLKESIDLGVPIIAMPMHLDQPMNAKLAVELGVGVEVKRDADGRLQRGEIRNVIRDVVVGKTGEVLRRKVVEKREKIILRSREEADGVGRTLAELCVQS